MYEVLIADDERIEREGIRFYISKLGLPLQVAEVENGRQALAYLEGDGLEGNRRVDILITDIKMPFMDGLELAARARERCPSVQIVILSAFGEFEYAKRAIPLRIAHYLLKPLELAEFAEVMSRVIAACREEREQEAAAARLRELHDAGLQYRREKLLLDLLHGSGSSGQAWAELAQLGWQCRGGEPLCMALLQTESKCFDAAGEQLKSALLEIIPWPFEYVNLNEYQSVLVLVPGEGGEDRHLLEAAGKRIQRLLSGRYGAQANIVFSPLLHLPGNMAAEFEEMERAVEAQFFMQEPGVFFTGVPHEEEEDGNSALRLDTVIGELSAAMSQSERGRITALLERLFYDLEASPHQSSIYVKYICTEIVRLLYAHREQYDPADFRQKTEEIFKAQNLGQLKELLMTVAGEVAAMDKDSLRKAVEEVLRLIHRDYRQDLGLEDLARQVYLSPNYLSRMFKKETGTSIIKYITAYRLDKARELLLKTNMKAVDIAMEVGYDNFSYFCSLFRSYYGTTPGKFREGEPS
ncbi:MAG: hypothetical protein K0R57_5247 [Paenibacillaceae bacterium]|jgi:two-component system response regulator YesN|nr:hypothetical protein [Paenibacillaceae bacterium]